MTSSFDDVSDLMTSSQINDADMLDLVGGSTTVVTKETVVKGGDDDKSQMMMSQSMTSSMYGGDLDQPDLMTSSISDVGDLMTSSTGDVTTDLMTSSEADDVSIPVLATGAFEQVSHGGVEINMLQPGLLGRDQVILLVHVQSRRESER